MEQIQQVIGEYLEWEKSRGSDHHSWEGFVYWLTHKSKANLLPDNQE